MHYSIIHAHIIYIYTGGVGSVIFFFTNNNNITIISSSVHYYNILGFTHL